MVIGPTPPGTRVMCEARSELDVAAVVGVAGVHHDRAGLDPLDQHQTGPSRGGDHHVGPRDLGRSRLPSTPGSSGRLPDRAAGMSAGSSTRRDRMPGFAQRFALIRT